jgi:UDP-N-acetylglucosamine 2-epimerase (non-hydrolysing)
MPGTSPGPIAVILGTRPEAIKLAPVVLELRRRGIPHRVVVTGQHATLVEGILRLFDIEADVDLGLMRPGQTLDYLLGAALERVGDLLERERPIAVVVQGDTTSMLGSALAAFHHRVPVAHVEAGLRSGDRDHPFPEEMNRRAAAIVSRWHFAPTQRAADNLVREGIAADVHVCGNTVVDALLHIVGIGAARVPNDLAAFLDGHPYVLATAHRRESWDGGIAEIARGLRALMAALPDHRLVFATHPNPVVRGPVNEILGSQPGVLVLDALDYPAFIGLLRGARLAISDSGGVQEEGPTLGVPVLVTRSTTERPEGLEAGAVRLVRADGDLIRDEALALLTRQGALEAMRSAGAGLYGDGHAARRMVEILAREAGVA